MCYFEVNIPKATVQDIVHFRTVNSFAKCPTTSFLHSIKQAAWHYSTLDREVFTEHINYPTPLNTAHILRVAARWISHASGCCLGGRATLLERLFLPLEAETYPIKPTYFGPTKQLSERVAVFNYYLTNLAVNHAFSLHRRG